MYNMKERVKTTVIICGIVLVLSAVTMVSCVI